jgi:biotin transport system substrate-specific component
MRKSSIVNLLNVKVDNIGLFCYTVDVRLTIRAERRYIMSANQSAVKQSAFTTREIVTMAMFAAILCISAYISISIPVPGSPHVTLLNFVILLIALLFPMYQSLTIIAVWMILGIIGIPVFIGGASGIGYLLSAWGGYTVSYLFVAAGLPLLTGKKYSRIRYTILAIVGALFIDLFGMVWLKMLNGLSWEAAFLTGFVVFLPLDMLKSVVVAQIIPAFKRIMP